MASFNIKKLEDSVVSMARKIGYVIIDTKSNEEYNLVRKLTGNNYPRFHIYVKPGITWNFSLHLDQKKPIYGAKGVHAHNGEYFGPIIDSETDRIKSLLQ